MLLVSLSYMLSGLNFFSNVTVEEGKTKEKSYKLQGFHSNNYEKKFVENGETLLYLTQSRNSVRLTAAWSSFLHMTWRK